MCRNRRRLSQARSIHQTCRCRLCRWAIARSFQCGCRHAHRRGHRLAAKRLPGHRLPIGRALKLSECGGPLEDHGPPPVHKFVVAAGGNLSLLPQSSLLHPLLEWADGGLPDAHGLLRDRGNDITQVRQAGKHDRAPRDQLALLPAGGLPGAELHGASRRSFAWPAAGRADQLLDAGRFGLGLPGPPAEHFRASKPDSGRAAFSSWRHRQAVSEPGQTEARGPAEHRQDFGCTA
mmetsp:Transcript_31977/g.91753  ORF Transcript_31977/g.91753 Transcript_31977/m.91753 type:complete len:234 (+) Transcript_31977:483-1184(+)